MVVDMLKRRIPTERRRAGPARTARTEHMARLAEDRLFDGDRLVLEILDVVEHLTLYRRSVTDIGTELRNLRWLMEIRQQGLPLRYSDRRLHALEDILGRILCMRSSQELRVWEPREEPKKDTRRKRVGATIRDFREARGLTRRGLADELRISETMINRVESGVQAQRNASTVDAIMVHLCIPPDAIA